MGTADFLAWRDHQQSFEQVAVLDVAGGSFALSGMGAPERIPGVGVSANFFSVFGVAPLKGRGFQPGEDRPGAPGVVVISEQFWRHHLDSDPAGTEPHAYARRQVAYDRRRHAGSFPLPIPQASRCLGDSHVESAKRASSLRLAWHWEDSSGVSVFARP